MTTDHLSAYWLPGLFHVFDCEYGVQVFLSILSGLFPEMRVLGHV